ncbi:dTDP-4-dehydrorhamnose reductase [Flavobacterium antarcticum]|uniref:dTDP-4-dehydrorhamnose reductase n=1 Tax=Flavobacterium antarcticum TaxID=271155 RepID=UPI0003B487AA|nr:dTDP-4-dehydrorhamnose reductase [Flavobacterium antarcticum]
MKNVLVTGGSGQLGSALKSVQEHFEELHFSFKSSNELDITSQSAIENLLDEYHYDIIVNTAAYTAVDKAESDFENAQKINATAVRYLAEAAFKRGITLIHISTDYVFDGVEPKARLETDPTNPIGVYGQTKLEGEEFALNANPKTIIIRTAWVYSEFGSNFLKTMLRLFNEKTEISVINDQVGSPTNATDLAKVIGAIASADQLVYGIFNYSNEGQCSWFEFATKIKELVHSSIEVKPISSTQYVTAAKRPAYSLLNKDKIKNTYAIAIPHWTNSLEEVVGNMVK